MSAEGLDHAMAERMLELQPRIRWRQLAQRAGMDEANLRRIRKGQITLTAHAARGIDDALEWPHGTAMAHYLDQFPQEPPLPSVRPEDYPTPPGQEDDGWTDADEAFYRALTELLKRQGLKPTPAIIQAMRDEWEREQAELAERNESDYSG